MSATTVACLGKGGTGKTLVSTLIGRLARDAGLRVLMIDADPVQGLTLSCGLNGIPTVADARERIIDRVRALKPDSPEGETSEIVAYMLAHTLVERDGLAFIAMGQSRSLGCYCSLNLLLRKMIGAILQRFDLVVVDAEAGIEQVNRQVMERIDQALLLSDGSHRAVQGCLLVRDTVAKIPMMSECRLRVLFNRVPGVPEVHRLALEQAGLTVLGYLPADEQVSRADAEFGALVSLGSDSPTFVALRNLLPELWVHATA